ncbi:MAG TPA: hypothetical protein VG737_04850 [Cyclobacteriaceae bacterium]|nr:hypothetical protein [Cyclobacteriaceae bacterium]
MELRDFLITPVVLMMVYAGAYAIRPVVTDAQTRRYFIPGLTVRILGAIALGLVYQHYYGWGDTFNYHSNGSRIVWESFMDNPSNLLRLVFGANDSEIGIYKYSSKIVFFHDPNSYFIVRIASLFDVLTFSSYSGTAVFFSVFSFTGMWMLFQTFYKEYPHLHFRLAVATLFVPSVVFWGSGILKDTVILACIGMATHQIHSLFIQHRWKFYSVVILLASLYLTYKIRVFVLQAYLPAVILWVFAGNFQAIRSTVVKIMAVPFVTCVLLVSAYYAVVKVGEDDKKYSVTNLARTSKITAYDIGFYTGRGAGSSYALEVSDWTPLGMLRSAPAAINVSLFRPYIWEARNPLMLISSMESTVLFVFTLYILISNFRLSMISLTNQHVLFCLIFSLVFAFAIGISTFNFGTLTRYRILLLPFFALALVIMNDYSKRERKLSVLEATE